MGYFLATSQIRAPNSMREENSMQFAQQRTLSGAVSRDYFGDIKRVWTLEYENVNKDDYFDLRSIYNDFLTNGDPVEWEITEDNYFINETFVHVDLLVRDFTTKGSSYISSFTLVLTEN